MPKAKNKGAVLKTVGQVKVPPFRSLTKASELFKVNIGEGARVKIKVIPGLDFWHYFADLDVEMLAESKLLLSDLKESWFYDHDVHKALGGVENAATSLDEFWTLLTRVEQYGRELLVNGKRNIFYIYNIQHFLWKVVAYWKEDGWVIIFDCIDERNEAGYQGDRVFSKFVPIASQPSV